MKLKYVIIDRLSPVIFLASLEHSAFRALGEITSAGFVTFSFSGGGLEVTTYGKSDSLKMEPQSEDAKIIKLFVQKNMEVKV